MRPVLHGDLAAAACALLRLAPDARAGLLRQMLAEAEGADAFRKHSGRGHPQWGNGSLMAAAMAHPRAPEPYLNDPDYAACLVLVLRALQEGFPRVG